ncbi:MAG: helix-turn-helix domain-containing protein [Symploca sp. SIO3C6]|nr:helix-turn-helix domain-containing protein [Symploca sp. SIO3C6]
MYNPGRRHPRQPKAITQREQKLIDLYSNCKLGMTPQQFYTKWEVTHETIAYICSRSISTVRFWFARGRSYRRPMATDLRHLALMDFLLEHFEKIPEPLLNLLCSNNQSI